MGKITYLATLAYLGNLGKLPGFGTMGKAGVLGALLVEDRGKLGQGKARETGVFWAKSYTLSRHIVRFPLILGTQGYIYTRFLAVLRGLKTPGVRTSPKPQETPQTGEKRATCV